MTEKSLDESALDRKYFIDNSVYNCPFCNRRNVAYDLSDDWVFDWSAEKKCYGYIVRCSSCDKESMHLSSSYLIEPKDPITGRRHYRFLRSSADIDSDIFYSVPTSFFTVDPLIPKTIRELITEAEGSQRMNYLTGASACMRKSIYELLVYEELKDGNYEDRIKSLKCKYPSINSELFDILGHIQHMTSNKVHEQSWDKWNSSTIRLILETTKEILHEIYVLPAKREQHRDRIMQLRQEVGKS